MKLLFKPEEESNTIAFKESQSQGSNHFISMVNLIGNNRKLLAKIFQNTVYNENGLYMLKIFK